VGQHPSTGRAAATSGPAFDERLSVPLWWYLPAIGVAALLGAEIHMGYPGLRAWIGYAVTVPLVVLVLYRLGRTRIRVADGVLRVGDATLPLHRVGQVDVVPRERKQPALGPELDPTAHLVHRPWIGALVRVEVRPGADTGPEDPRDPGRAPYWIFSVRDPDALLTALRR
jgi:hypothetical protein